MKNLLFLPALALVLSAGTCSDTEKMDISSLNNAKLLLQSLNGNDISLPDGVDTPWIKLNKTDNSLTGFGGCNSLFGNFTQKASELNFSGIGSTKKYCDEVQDTEKGLMTALNNTKNAQFTNGVLMLMDGSNVLASFKKAE